MKDEKGKLIDDTPPSSASFSFNSFFNRLDEEAKREERYQVEALKRRLKNIEQIKPLFREKGYTEKYFNDFIAPHILVSGKDKALTEFLYSPSLHERELLEAFKSFKSFKKGERK